MGHRRAVWSARRAGLLHRARHRTFFATDWEVHYNSSRTGVRSDRPQPQWARSDGGEAGLHPSNIHDNAYAIGAIDFTGDMPVILGPDGPSLGGFVCPRSSQHGAVEARAAQAGDRCAFIASSASGPRMQEAGGASYRDARAAARARAKEAARAQSGDRVPSCAIVHAAGSTQRPAGCIDSPGDKYLLIEYGPLDARSRICVSACMR
jgi:urea carboxylase